MTKDEKKVWLELAKGMMLNAKVLKKSAKNGDGMSSYFFGCAQQIEYDARTIRDVVKMIQASRKRKRP